ncbi:hypothetical protein [Aquimarina sp. I32.4]|uniref:hypothetical protein n=1 Tax=Aquimarina sp. I32.4 TaxID=2053903 RepID=UPI000CDEE764|nr:hypothetical protein [Aquimarina sp. I32.4]
MKFIFYESELKTGIHELRLLVFLIVFLGTYSAISQGSVCFDPIGDTGADPFCSVAGIVFPNCNSLNSDCTVEAESGPDYGCLISQPFPAWYCLRIKNSGTMEFTILQTQNEDGTGTQLDVDFICYDPL